jgi:hypothetical protein
MSLYPRCRCGHGRVFHRHHNRSVHCALVDCACPRYRWAWWRIDRTITAP